MSVSSYVYARIGELDAGKPMAFREAYYDEVS